MCALVAVGVFRCQLQPHSQIMWPKKLLGFRCFISFHFIFCLEVYSCLSRLMYIMPNLFYSRVECSAEGNRPYLLKLSIPSPIPCPCPCPCLFSNPKLARRSGFQFFSYARCRLRFMVFESFHSGWRTRSKKPFSCFLGRFVRQRRLIKNRRKNSAAAAAGTTITRKPEICRQRYVSLPIWRAYMWVSFARRQMKCTLPCHLFMIGIEH